MVSSFNEFPGSSCLVIRSRVCSASLVKRRGGIHFSLVMPEKKMLQLHLEKALDLKILLKPVDIDTLVSDYALSGEKGEPPIQ